MYNFWEIYLYLTASFAILLMVQTLPKIMKELNCRLTFLQKLVHNTSFLFLGALLMPIMSIIVLTDEKAFVDAYIGAWDDESE
jgi:hypothetical protein